MNIGERDAHRVRATFEGRNVPLSEDLSLNGISIRQRPAGFPS